jgi:hypothetical protein
VDALHRVMSGGIYISPRFSERLVFKVIQSGRMTSALRWTPCQIASLRFSSCLARPLHTADCESLHLSVKTIVNPPAHIKEKLRCKDAEEMVTLPSSGWPQRKGRSRRSSRGVSAGLGRRFRVSDQKNGGFAGCSSDCRWQSNQGRVPGTLGPHSPSAIPFRAFRRSEERFGGRLT